jgi:protein-L-isoaspartate(D-aspartate) O-methyltransferase
VRVLHGDALGRPFDAADCITVNAGATHPPAAWLDGVAPGGRLLLPLTTDEGWRRFDAAQIARRGAVFLIARDRGGYPARWLSPGRHLPLRRRPHPGRRRRAAVRLQARRVGARAAALSGR